MRLGLECVRHVDRGGKWKEGRKGGREKGRDDRRGRRVPVSAADTPAGSLGFAGGAEGVKGSEGRHGRGREGRPEGTFEGGVVPSAFGQLLYEADEFGGVEGLGEKRVDADLQPRLDLELRTGADDGEGQAAGTGIGTQPGGGAQAVEPRHRDVEGDDIGADLMNDIQTLGTISRGHDLETLQFEVDPDQLPDDLVVVHNKNPAGHARHNSRVGRDRPPRPAFAYFHGTDRAPTRPAPGSQNPFLITPNELVGFYPSQRNAPDTPP